MKKVGVGVQHHSLSFIFFYFFWKKKEKRSKGGAANTFCYGVFCLPNERARPSFFFLKKYTQGLLRHCFGIASLALQCKTNKACTPASSGAGVKKKKKEKGSKCISYADGGCRVPKNKKKINKNLKVRSYTLLAPYYIYIYIYIYNRVHSYIYRIYIRTLKRAQSSRLHCNAAGLKIFWSSCIAMQHQQVPLPICPLPCPLPLPFAFPFFFFFFLFYPPGRAPFFPTSPLSHTL